MRDDFDVRLPKREIDRAYELLDEIDAMTELSTEECVILVVSLRSLAAHIEETVHDYCVRGYYEDKDERDRGQIEMLRSLSAMEKGGPDMAELERDDGKAAA